MARQIAEQSNALSIFWLKRNGYLPKGGGWVSGSIQWTYRASGIQSSIGFSVMAGVKERTGEDDHIRLQYNHTIRTSGQVTEVQPMDYQVRLAATPCRYGGLRYWFICPLAKDGQPCGRRVGVLYCLGKYFGCRICGNIAYAAQMEGGRFRSSVVSIPDIEQAEKDMKRPFYNGRPTRKHRRLIRLNERFNHSLFKVAVRLDRRFGSVASHAK